MNRAYCSTIWIALASIGALVGSAPSAARAQTAPSYCLTGGGDEIGRCGFPTFEECRAYSSGFGICVASDRPAWTTPTAGLSTAQPKRRR
jgi:hypothetical protein